MNIEIEKLLRERGAGIVRFVDISSLPMDQTQGFVKAVLFCIPLSKGYVQAVRDGADIDVEHDEFVDREHETDAVADWLAGYLNQAGYRAYSQSEISNAQNGNFNPDTRSSKLPHKTIATLAGIGFIGKNNLLITDEYGCAFSMCTVLTDAPVAVESHPPLPSKCKGCDICKQACPANAITGNEWTEDTKREDLVDVFKCTCALKCMVHCPQTQNYAM
ncbi:MAG: 4Fe-4S binding protein [Peptococcaceae bacterium]|jgi:epoxyqueuosine reductase QueG|nr:4Fe-4S binding protein [Peptococcaceae bacterium]